MMASMDPETLRSMGEQFSGPGGGGGFGSGMDPAMMAKMEALQASMPPDLMQPAAAGGPGVAARTADMLRNNPAMMSTASDMLAGMSPEQLDRFAAQSGLPAVRPAGLGMIYLSVPEDTWGGGRKLLLQCGPPPKTCRSLTISVMLAIPVALLGGTSHLRVHSSLPEG